MIQQGDNAERTVCQGIKQLVVVTVGEHGCCTVNSVHSSSRTSRKEKSMRTWLVHDSNRLMCSGNQGCKISS